MTSKLLKVPVQSTLQMRPKFIQLEPEIYYHSLATLQWMEREDKVGAVASKLLLYEDTISAS